MKRFIRCWLLSRKLRAIKREMEHVLDVRMEAIRREVYLKGCAEAVRVELLHLDIRNRRHARA